MKRLLESCDSDPTKFPKTEEAGEPEDPGSTFFWIVKQGSSEQLQQFLVVNSDWNINVKHPLGWRAVHVAAVNGNVNIMKVLLDNGADPNLVDVYTNVHSTASKKEEHTENRRREEFHDSLDPKLSYLGFTALHYAVLIENVECVKLLLARGANPNIESLGKTSLALTKDQEIKSLLENASDELRESEGGEEEIPPLEQRLKQVIVGQDNAIRSVADAMRRKEHGWVDDEHPMVFLFLGSSGVGKTALAQHLAKFIYTEKTSNAFPRKNPFVRIDMSEYQETHTVSRFIGAPPGYVGYGDGQLTNHLTHRPNSLVLLDEIDKAHTDVLTILLQLFDEGRLTDGKGKTVVCTNAVFVMTSNLGNTEIADHARQQNMNNKSKNVTGKVTISNTFKEKVIGPILKKHFKRDEFLGRINELVIFLPFSDTELNKLVSMELNFWAKKAVEKHQVTLDWDTDVESILAGGYNCYYGARSIKHEVERKVVNKLAAASAAERANPIYK